MKNSILSNAEIYRSARNVEKNIERKGEIFQKIRMNYEKKGCLLLQITY